MHANATKPYARKTSSADDEARLQGKGKAGRAANVLGSAPPAHRPSLAKELSLGMGIDKVNNKCPRSVILCHLKQKTLHIPELFLLVDMRFTV